jgi:hypothetical protein
VRTKILQLTRRFVGCVPPVAQKPLPYVHPPRAPPGPTLPLQVRVSSGTNATKSSYAIALAFAGAGSPRQDD